MGERPFLFMRHGETAHNRLNVRCGGDVDIPLTEQGEQQARDAAKALAALPDRIDVIIASPLLRTRRTAEIVQVALGAVPIQCHDGLIERRLGDWNGMSIAETQPLINAGATPPGGEGEMEFRDRVGRALADIAARGNRLPLLVGSKGVGRVLGILLGNIQPPMANAKVFRFYFPA